MGLYLMQPHCRMTYQSNIGDVMERFRVFINNGYRFEYVGTHDGETIIKARKDWLRLNAGSNAGIPANVKFKRQENTPDKRELYKTAQINSDGPVFKTGEYVSVKVKYRMVGGWVFECRNGDRKADYAEGFLTNFCL